MIVPCGCAIQASLSQIESLGWRLRIAQRHEAVEVLIVLLTGHDLSCGTRRGRQEG